MIQHAIHYARDREYAPDDSKDGCDEGTEGHALLGDLHHERTQIVDEEDTRDTLTLKRRKRRRQTEGVSTLRVYEHQNNRSVGVCVYD